MAIAWEATKLGVPVCLPLHEHGRYDLILEIAHRPWRVQVKWATLQREGDVIVIRTGGCRHTPQGYVYATYGEDEIDLVAGVLRRAGPLLPGPGFARRREARVPTPPLARPEPAEGMY
jgi:PD-(D/E)XK endonuclease